MGLTKLDPDNFVTKLKKLHAKALKGEVGYHDQIFQGDRALQEDGIPDEVIFEFTKRARDTVSRRYASDKELADAINYGCNGNPKIKGGSRRVVRTVEPSQAAIDTWANLGNLDELLGFSDSIPQTTQEILADLYEPDDLLFIHTSLGLGPIRSCEEWCQEDLSKMQFICQSTLKDRDAGRNNDNVKAQKYLVFETDDLPRDWDSQAGLITRLTQELGLPKMILTTTSKSLHAHWSAEGYSAAQIQKWRDVATMLSGDRQLLTVPCQLVRLPYGTHAKTKLQQKVIFYKHD